MSSLWETLSWWSAVRHVQELAEHHRFSTPRLETPTCSLMEQRIHVVANLRLLRNLPMRKRAHEDVSTDRVCEPRCIGLLVGMRK